MIHMMLNDEKKYKKRDAYLHVTLVLLVMNLSSYVY